MHKSTFYIHTKFFQISKLGHGRGMAWNTEHIPLDATILSNAFHMNVSLQKSKMAASHTFWVGSTPKCDDS